MVEDFLRGFYSLGACTMMDELKILVVSGGDSPEAEVSRKSGMAVEGALKKHFHKVSHFEFDRHLPRKIWMARPDVVFPTLHGGLGENGAFQGLLEVMNLPYVGSGVAACALAMNKALAKTQFQANGIPVVDGFVCHSGDSLPALSIKVIERFPDGVVIKPCAAGSALGVSFCETHSQILEGLSHALSFGNGALIEKRFRGREITVGVLADPEPRALPPVEIVVSDGWFDFYHRYTPYAAQHICPVPLIDAIRQRIEEVAIASHVTLGCRHFSRIDMLLGEDGEVVVLEVNTLPGMTETSLYPDAARAAGIPFEALVRRLVEMAIEGSK